MEATSAYVRVEPELTDLSSADGEMGIYSSVTGILTSSYAPKSYSSYTNCDSQLVCLIVLGIVSFIPKFQIYQSRASFDKQCSHGCYAFLMKSVV